MLSAIRRRMTYANVAMTLALVFAMSGGAYAAKKYLITSTKQIKPSVLAQLKGKAGANGAPGAAGPAGPQGPAGAKGENGAAGSNGTNGSNGKSVVASAAAVPAECPTGTTGTKFEVEGSGSPSHVCDGKNGTTGFTSTLPAGKTERGLLGFSTLPKSLGLFGLRVPISFSIPLGAALGGNEVHLVEVGQSGPGGAGEECEGGTSAEPKAASGNLCIYLTSLEGAFPGEPPTPVTASAFFVTNIESPGFGAGISGALLTSGGLGLPEGAAATAVWAVTG